jgi:hypothetical protein
MKIADRVSRDEDRETTGATVLDVQGEGEEAMALIDYDEGGQGWWPVSALLPLPEA